MACLGQPGFTQGNSTLFASDSSTIGRIRENSFCKEKRINVTTPAGRILHRKYGKLYGINDRNHKDIPLVGLCF